MHFSKIIKLGKKRHTLLCILLVFELSLKNAWLPPIFVLHSNSHCQNLLFPLSHKPCKNTSVLVGIYVILDFSNRRGTKPQLLTPKK